MSTALKARFVVTSEHNQLGQFAAPAHPDGKPKPPVLAPITSATLVAQEKKQGTEDINEPVWRDAPNGQIDIKFARPEALAGFKPGTEVIVTLELVEPQTETIQ